ncbi:hemin uptake protein HemP [Amorphus sp. 3PC139-8]|uniref:hemin uptake protein HemP n=1 Tax=Amorphus sp. 3PC139-8 TaxID=2735676 RepID=UPI00345D74E0
MTQGRNAAPSHDEKQEPYRWSAEDLCGPRGEAEIVLDGDVYRLRITSRRRLILTK